jgi:hypothetical protein
MDYIPRLSTIEERIVDSQGIEAKLAATVKATGRSKKWASFGRSLA